MKHQTFLESKTTLVICAVVFLGALTFALHMVFASNLLTGVLTLLSTLLALVVWKTVGQRKDLPEPFSSENSEPEMDDIAEPKKPVDSQKPPSKVAGLIVTFNKGELIAHDGEVVEGFAFVDESAIAGVSSPVIVEASTGRNQVFAGGLVVEGSIKIRCK
ncbi:MAG: hypothetical protein IAF58_08825 [Leptolyngbya sp.]|nr:hypothetical protein [Candidatus Melainabacteria bacterium]